MSTSRSRRSIYLDAEQLAELTEVAKRDDRSVSSVVRLAIATYLAQQAALDDLRHPKTNSTLPDTRKYEVFNADGGVQPGERTTAPPDEWREPTDEEARHLSEAFPNLKQPKVRR